MPRPTSLIKASFLGGEDDATPATLEETQSSTVENLYRQRRSYIRRKGQSALGSASLSPDQDLNGLEWGKFGTSERLIGIHAGDVVDFFADPVGAVVGNGTDKLPTNTDADFAWINEVFVIGNGTDPNIRYNGQAGTTNPNALDLESGSSQSLIRNPNGFGLGASVDLGINVWVKPESLGADMTICSVWDNTTSSQMAFFLNWDASDARFQFAIMNGTGPPLIQHDATQVIAVGTWYNIAAWYDRTLQTANIQVNNGSVQSIAVGAGINGATTAFRVGALDNSGTPVEFWDGLIDNLGIWVSATGGGAALSSGVRSSLYNGGTGKTYSMLSATEKTGLIAWYDLEETGAANREDAHGAFDLTALNAPGTGAGVGDVDAVEQIMPSNPSGSFTAADSGNPGNPSGTYTYKVAFLSADGYPTEATASSNSITVDTNQVSLTSIPTPTAGQDASGRRLYRNKATSSATWYFLADINDTTTTSYTDNIADASLGDEWVSGKTTFPPCKFLVEHQDRVFGSGNANEPQIVYISDVDEYMYYRAAPDFAQETYDPNQGTSLTLQGRAAGATTGMCAHGDMVAVFTGAAGYFVQGDQPQNFRHQRFTDVGCVAHRTIKSFKSLLIWLAPDGVYLFEGRDFGTNVVRISDSQRVTIEAMSADDMAKAWAYVWEGRYYLNWPTGCIVCDLEYRPFVWTTNTNNLWRIGTTSVFTSSARERIWASKYGAARVYQLETGATDAIPSAGTAIPVVLETKDWDMGYSGREKRVHWVDVRVKKGTGTLTTTLKKGSGQTVQTATHDISTVDDSSETVSRQFVSAVEQARSEFFRLRLAYSGTASELELIAAACHYTLST